MPRAKSALWHLGALLLLAFTAAGCLHVPPAALQRPTGTPIPTPGRTPTPCTSGWNWAYGTVTPEFLTRLAEAMAAAGLEGDAQAGTFGENDGCGGYHAMSVDYVFTVQVENLEAGDDLARKAARILDIARRFVAESPAPNLGKLQLTFQAEGGRQCGWYYASGAWNAAGLEGEGTCAAPVTVESRRLADALSDLSADLGCETSAVTTNARQSMLECERPEGRNRYLVSVTFGLNEQGYDGTCFHGYRAFESSTTGDEPMTVTENGTTYFERGRSFQWTANELLIGIWERVRGGLEVEFPADIREIVYRRARLAGLISGEGSDCH